MMTAVQVDAYRNTVRASVIAAAIGVASIPLEAPRYGFWPLGFLDLAHAVEAVVIGVCLVRFGRRWSTRRLDTLFVLLVAPYLVTLWMPPVAELAHGHPVEPLLGHHFLMLALAMLSPSSYRLSLALIVVAALEAVVLAEFLRDEGAAAEVAREPYFTLMFTGIALAVQWSAFRRRTLAIELATAETRGEAHAKTARILLAMRDRANSPLQTIEIGLRVLEKRAADQRGVLAVLRGALQKLVDIQRGLADLGPTEDVVSPLDLGADLSEKIRQLDIVPSSGDGRLSAHGE